MERNRLFRRPVYTVAKALAAAIGHHGGRVDRKYKKGSVKLVIRPMTVDAINLILELKFPSLEFAYFLIADGWPCKVHLYFFFESLTPTFQFNDMTFNGHR